MEGDDSITEDESLQASIVSPFINFAKFVLIATALISVVFSIVNLVKHPRVLKRSIVGVVVMAVLLLIAYSVSSDAEVTDSVGRVLKDGEAGAISKWVSTGIWFSAILGVVGLGFFMVDFVRGLVK